MMRKRIWELGVGAGGTNPHCFQQDVLKFEMPMRSMSGEVRETVGYVISEFRVMINAEI